MPIRRLVLDVLKPIRGISIVDLAERLSSLTGVDGVNISVTDMDVETMGLLVVIEGSDIDFEEVRRILDESGAAIHSIDEVASGKVLVRAAKGEE